MSVIAFCLTAALLQNPAATTAPQDPPGTDAVGLAGLLRAERDGPAADLGTLASLVDSTDATVAERAIWLLGRNQDPKAIGLLHGIAAAGAEPRRQQLALQALGKVGNQSSVPTALAALGSSDSTVRALAVQLLGRLRPEGAVPPLLGLLTRPAEPAEGPAAVDRVAALVALHDLGAAEHLLPAATAVQSSGARGLGEALAYTFQELSPKLATDAEVTLLLGVLDHPEALLRRHAIHRLAELAVPTTAAALEKRLGAEGDELRPLLEVALVRIRGDHHGSSTPAATDDQGLLATARQRWQQLTATAQYVCLGCGALSVVALLATLIAWLRRRNQLLAATADTDPGQEFDPTTMEADAAMLEVVADDVVAEAELVAVADEEPALPADTDEALAEPEVAGSTRDA